MKVKKTGKDVLKKIINPKTLLTLMKIKKEKKKIRNVFTLILI